MKFVTVTHLKNKTSEAVRTAERGEVLVVLRHGKPCAALLHLADEDMDQLLFETSAWVRKQVKDALADLDRGRRVALRDYVRSRFSP